MMVDLLRSTVRPLGTGMSSNSLRWTRVGLDAQAVAASRQSDRTRMRRMASTSWRSSYNQWGWSTKFLAWTLVTPLLSGCASPSVPPMGYQGKPFRPEADERQLGSAAEKEEEKLAKLGKTYDDPLLEDYLASVAARLVPQEAQRAGAPPPPHARFRGPPLNAFSRAPTLNAFAMPNGKVYIHTGLLSRVENEAQLSMILGHELTHVTNRHALMFNRDAQNKQIWFTALAIAASLGVAVAAGSQQGKGNYVTAEVLRATSNIFLGLGLQLAFIASVNGFGRDLEREADREGMERMVKAGYDPAEGPRRFALLKDDHGDGSKLENFFFGNHPRLDERIANTQELLKTNYAATETAGGVRKTHVFSLAN